MPADSKIFYNNKSQKPILKNTTKKQSTYRPE